MSSFGNYPPATNVTQNGVDLVALLPSIAERRRRRRRCKGRVGPFPLKTFLNGKLSLSLYPGSMMLKRFINLNGLGNLRNVHSLGNIIAIPHPFYSEKDGTTICSQGPC
jgi:hypothetical protein